MISLLEMHQMMKLGEVDWKTLDPAHVGVLEAIGVRGFDDWREARRE